MPTNFLNRLLAPPFPATAIGLERGRATVVQLERQRPQGFVLKRAATVTLSTELIRPSFDEPNITDSNELAETLSEIATSAGLLKERRWSVALPEAAARTIILTMESAPGSRKEQEEVLRWKTERGFGLPLEELRVARESLPPDAQGRARYVTTCARLSVLEEYESVFQSLGWNAGLILPRHLSEARWLMQSGASRGDALLVSTSEEGFTAVMLRDSQPSIVRSVVCAAEECANELYRMLLFYRDRLAAQSPGAEGRTLERLLVVDGHGFGVQQVKEIVSETLGIALDSLDAAGVGLALPTADISFDALAAPAGLATMAW